MGLKHFSLIAALALALAACASGRPDAELIPDGPSLWRFRARVAPSVPLDAPGGEAGRLARLREELRLIRQCPRGYTVTDRVVANASLRFFEAETYVYYSGRCR